MLVTRLTNVFQLTTTPTNLTRAVPHTAGWTESLWTTLTPSAIDPFWTVWQNKRALLLPTQASIVGYRSQVYTMTGNKLLPGGASSGKQQTPGNSQLVTDLPQVSLEITLQASGAPNNARPVLRGMPDSIMLGGEYQPTPTFSAFFTQFRTALVGFNFGFIGRDLAQASVRVLSIAGGIITLDAVPATGLAVGDFVRLNRVTSEAGNPIKGAFRVAVIAANVITVTGLNATVTQPSGTLRRDQLAYFAIGDVRPGRAVVKKVGRPLQGYRGRRSKQTA